MFNINDAFPFVPKPIRNMQNMFSFSSKKKQFNFSQSRPQSSSLASNKGFWREIGGDAGSKIKNNHHTMNGRRNKQREKISYGHSNPASKDGSINNNNGRTNANQQLQQSSLAMFGGNEYGWKHVAEDKTSKKTAVEQFSLDEAIKRRKRVNDVINSYKRSTSTKPTPLLRSNKFDEHFTKGNVKSDYLKIHADDASLKRNTNYDNTKDSNYQQDSSQLSPYKG